MIYLDTHIVVWLFAGLENKFTQFIKDLLNKKDITISPIVRLELQYLHEIQRVSEDANSIITDLSSRLGLSVCDKEFNAVINKALEIPWTRDPFDRVIVANASLDSSILVSKDPIILEHYPLAQF